MTERRRWRVAILGLGHWYSAYGLARALAEYPRAELDDQCSQEDWSIAEAE